MITKPSRPSVIGAIAIALMLASVAIGLAQTQVPPPTQNTPPGAPSDPRMESPLRLEVVLSRLDAKGTAVSRMPYVFSATSAPPGNACRLRMGAQVPIGNSMEYRSIGTNIDCQVRPMLDNRFQIVISIDENSILGDDADPNTPPKTGGFPIFRSYQSTNTVLLRSGDSARFTTAADRVSGETVVAEVTITVVK